MKVLGVDPGTYKTGWGFIEGTRGGFSRCEWGVIKPVKTRPLPQRLACVYDGLDDIRKKYVPDVIVCEDTFLHKDVRAALSIGRAWAMAALAAAKNGLPFSTYSPTEIKKSVTGYGRAGKEQMTSQIRTLLGISGEVPEDAADALSCAYCHLTDMRNYTQKPFLECAR
ncbi:crossover junction endodeoxyribonuclease RuvC [bacterium]|nr:crossover junction endodeoxyribonuclease RuvC [bacterium]MBU3955493.1 crossover junction endodeoxyribonuclease RuvC [bacterium]MBU4134289.1 crossover junction endodeoxyribonuclease RuvC [bacterium]